MSNNNSSLEGIAIVGMAGRFPGAKNVDEFWHNLQNGVESISFFSKEELERSNIDSRTLNAPNYVKAQAVLEGIELFDASFFGLNPREAEITDPQHRVFMECAWEALENAGYDTERYEGAIGVFAGTSVNSYLLVNLCSNPDLLETVGVLQILIRNRNDHLSTHTSYKLNLDGPSVTVQTACSTSLVSIHLACQSLSNGECDMALAGGVSIRVPQKAGYLYQQGGILSPDGHCRAFDVKAEGTVEGSGVGIVVLKRLADALADGDCIHAVIKGSAINNDGSLKIGYTAPSEDGQAQVIAEAQLVAGIETETISYIETHGTGTALGDPIEIAALTQAFRASTNKKGFCAIGSVKTNIGHLDTAAGVAGLIKTVMAMKHKQLPPSLNFEQPNPRISFENSPFYVNSQISEWKTGEILRRAGVSSFGMGGTNAHVVLEEAITVPHTSKSRPRHLLLLSAKTTSALEVMSANLVEHFQKHPDLNLADAAYTLQVGRRTFNYRRAIICHDIEDAVNALETLDYKRVYTSLDEPRPRPVVFMFTGQGAQYVNMGRELYQYEPTFRKQVDLCSELLKPHLGLDIRDVLYPIEEKSAEATKQLKQTYITQPALFVIEYALAKLWMEWGISPQAMIGHSVGEYVAACLAEVMSLEDALTLIAIRGRLMHSLPGGTMLAVSLPEKDVQPLLNKQLSLAAINGPSLCVVSGYTEAVDQLEYKLSEQGVVCRRLHTSHAFHSEMMEPILEEFTLAVRKVNLQLPQIPYISNVTGTWMTAEDAIKPTYWAKHLRQTVRFGEGVYKLLQQSDNILLEVGPGRTLMTIAKWHPYKLSEQIVLSSLPHVDEQSSDLAFLLTSLGKLWVAGVEVNWSRFYVHEEHYRVPLPTYPFERQRYWIEAKQGINASNRQKALSKNPNIADWFYLPSWKRSVLPRAFDSKDAGQQNFSWLVFIDECNLGLQIVNQLQQQNQNIITVAIAQQFSRLNDRAFTINPRQSGDYDLLLQELRALGKFPTKIVHLWNVTVNARTQSEIERAESTLDVSFYSLLFLAQALGKQNITDSLQVDVVSNNMQAVTGEEKLEPEKATMLGPCKVIPHEYPNITCHSIDVVIPESGNWHDERLVNHIIAEFTVKLPDASNSVVAYRGNHRWVQTFEAVQLDEAVNKKTRLRERGTYLISGGLGGIGLVLAEYLAQTVQANLVLIGRSAFPNKKDWEEWLATHDDHDEVSRKIHKVQKLEQLGADVLVFSADVADEKEMQEVIAKTYQHFDQIHGVIHAAGVAGGGMIPLKTPEMAANVLAPKVKGTQVLNTILKNANLDFFALCSSRSSILGGFGQIDYCAANAYLDAFAHYSTSRNGTFTVSINWDKWQEVGMLVDTAALLDGEDREIQQVTDYQPIEHPLLDQLVVKTPTQETYLTELSAKTHWVLDEHRLGRNPVVPGTAYLEMARASVEKHIQNGMIEIRDVFFLAPLGARDDEKVKARLVIEKDGDTWSFQVSSTPDLQNGSQSEWRQNSIGKIACVDSEPPKKHDLKKILEMCNVKEVTITSETPRDEDLGARWESLKKVYIGNNELLAILELPEEFQGDFEHMKLHPALLDRGTGTGKHFLVGEENGHYLPMSYKRLRIKKSLPRKIYTYIKQKENNYSSKETITFDVTIMDENGVELVEIEEFSQKRVNDAAVGIKALLGEKKQQINRANESKNIYQQGIKEGISPKEGTDAFSRLLSYNLLPQIIVSTKDIQASIEQQYSLTQSQISEEIEKIQDFKPTHSRPNVQTSYVAPRSELEKNIAEVWQEVLGIEQVGIYDNFFELGGDSVQAIQIIAKGNRLGLQFTAQQLFQHQTIADLAAEAGTTHTTQYEQSQLIDSVPFTSKREDYTPQVDFPLAGLDEQKLSKLSLLIEQIDKSVGN